MMKLDETLARVSFYNFSFWGMGRPLWTTAMGRKQIRQSAQVFDKEDHLLYQDITT